jgi:hypothetical protein
VTSRRNALVRNWLWTIAPLVFLILSVAAVSVHALQTAHVPRLISDLLERFASPGELLWWATLGGTFAGYPSGTSGYVVWVVGNTLFWILVTALCVGFSKGIRGALQFLNR